MPVNQPFVVLRRAYFRAIEDCPKVLRPMPIRHWSSADHSTGWAPSTHELSSSQFRETAKAIEIGVGMIVVRVEQDRMEARAACAAPTSIVTESPT